ncbi:MAG: glycosyltransferase [Nitrospiraceae bacterium]|nr:MAG: glycosyltransferase [Nitrospiraceae bacterium]
MRKKLAIVRGANLNKWEMQNYEPLSDCFDITAYTTAVHKYDTSHIKLSVMHLPGTGGGLLGQIEGLEDHLADKEIIFSADSSYLFSAQAIHSKIKHGNKVICLQWENIPFNYDDHEMIFKIKKMVRENADHFIAVTSRAKEALVLEGVPEEFIDVIPMGIDLNRFQPDDQAMMSERKRLHISTEEIVVLFIGRIVWEKGVYDLVHAASKILRDRELKKFGIRFVLAGNGPELKLLYERTAHLGIADSFLFLENYPYEEIHRLHNIADIFILPSIPSPNWQEQFGMVLIESMACRKPVVSTLSGSIPEVVGDAGLLVQPNDHVSLCEALKRLISDNELREEISIKALHKAEREFDSRKTAERFKRVFEKVLSRRTRGENIRALYEKGLQCWEAGDNEKGFHLACSAFAEDPDNREMLDSLVAMGRELNKLEDVELRLRDYLCYHPANIETLLVLAETLLNMGKPAQAEEELQKVFLFDSENKHAIDLTKQINSRLSI